MITIIEQNNKKLICSLELYKKVGYSPAAYSRWLKREIIGNATKEVDYFDYMSDPTSKRRPGYHGKRYLVTPEFALAVCFMAKTEVAKKLKFWIRSNNNLFN